MSTTNQVLDTLIIGAGISGLSLAFNLQTNQRQILVAESQGRIGGNITTNKAEGFIWEEGPNSFAPTPALLKLLVDVGLKSELVLADHRLPRYVYWRGELHSVPMTPPAAITSRLLSNLGKLRALVGALGFVPPAIGSHLSQQAGEETIAQFFHRHLGAEVAQRLVAPFVSGVYAGDVNQLSAVSSFRRVVEMAEIGGGLVPGAILQRQKTGKSRPQPDPNLPKTRPGELGSFKDGLEALPKAIALKLGEAVKLNWSLVQLRPTDHQTYIAEFDTPTGRQQVEARTVALTTPAYTTAALLQPLNAQASQALAAIPYPPVACVVLAYPESAISKPRKGFGNLIPRNQGIRTLGTIWSSILFPGRTPPGWQVFSNFIGGATDLEIATLNSNQIVQTVHQDLRRTLQIQDVSPKVLAVHLWEKAIPQYTLGHQQRLEQIEAGMKQLPGIYLCSNYIDGVSLGDCVRRAQENATNISQYLTATS